MQRYNIPVEQLKDLYFNKHLSTYKIALTFGCNRQTISNYLRQFNIPLKTKAQAQMRYHGRLDFTGFLEEKSYLIGFRLGDLNVYKPNGFSETIVARCHSTTSIQADLIEELFTRYGKVKITKGLYGYTINCFLNLSFDFLLPKKDNVENWIKQSNSTALAFIAGYVDAEGSFHINQQRARFSLASYDINILFWIRDFLNSYNIHKSCSEIIS